IFHTFFYSERNLNVLAVFTSNTIQMAEHLHTHHFSLEEARRELTLVHARASKLIELKKKLDAKGWDVYRHEYFGGRGPNGDGSFPEEMETLVEVVKGLEGRGIVVKGLENGLIDFPHIRSDGEEVYLCWKVGENDILYWHRIADGFAGRKSIDEL
ncbi:MAG: DUF2203 domain-containing protein, partial [bacterium]